MRRGRIEIARNVLLVCKKDAATKNRIIRRANLNSKIAGSHLNWLMDQELIIKEENIFRITPKGIEMLSNLQNLSPLVGS
jgi:predicted transcriptional regulator